MKLYLVAGEGYEGIECRGIFSSEEKANKVAKKELLDVIEFDLDEEVIHYL